MNDKGHGKKPGPEVLGRPNPHRIALSLKRTAERNSRHNCPPYQSAMSLLNFYITRAGSGLTENQREVLLCAKGELRRVFHKKEPLNALSAI